MSENKSKEEMNSINTTEDSEDEIEKDQTEIETDPEELLTSDENENTSFSDPSKKVEETPKETKETAKEIDDSDDAWKGKSDDEIIKELLADDSAKEEKILNKAEQRILSKIEASKQYEQKHRSLWGEFYKENPELEAHKDLVELQAEKLKNELTSSQKELRFDEGAKIVAKRTKALIDSIRRSNSEDVDTESSSSSAVVSSSSNSTPKQGKGPAKKSFTDQLRNIQQ